MAQGWGMEGSTSRSWSLAEHLGYCPPRLLTQEGHQMAPNHSKSHHIPEPGFLLLPLCAPSYLPSPLLPHRPLSIPQIPSIHSAFLGSQLPSSYLFISSPCYYHGHLGTSFIYPSNPPSIHPSMYPVTQASTLS